MRERMLEGFLLRLSAARDSDAYALRGGMLVRQWEPRRAVGDIDLVCALPDRPRDLRERLHEVLRRDARDGVVFDAERFRVDRIAIGHRLYAAGDVDERPAEIHVDLAFGLDVATIRKALVAARGTAPIAMVAHETVIATKLAVCAELGARAWRPKDLADVWLALRRFPASALGAALERRIGSARRAAAILAAPWWSELRAAMRWGRYVSRRPIVPSELDVVIADIRARLP